MLTPDLYAKPSEFVELALKVMVRIHWNWQKMVIPVYRSSVSMDHISVFEIWK